MKCLKTHTGNCFDKRSLQNVYDGEEAGFLCRVVDLLSPVKYYISVNLTQCD